MEPDDPACRATLATALLSADRPGEALAQISKAIQDVAEPVGWMRMNRILCNYVLGNLADAYDEAKQTVARIPDFYPGPVLAAALAVETGNREDAEAMRVKTLQSDPKFSAGLFVRSLSLKNQQHRVGLLTALTTAGLPA